MANSGTTTTNTTTATPNVFDIEKGKTAQLMNAFLMSNIQQGMQGQQGALDDSSTQNILQQLREGAGRYKIAPGSSTFQQAEQKMGESLTMPNQDMMSLAMSLYGVSQPASGMGEQTMTGKTDDPMGWTKTLQGWQGAMNWRS